MGLRLTQNKGKLLASCPIIGMEFLDSNAYKFFIEDSMTWSCSLSISLVLICLTNQKSHYCTKLRCIFNFSLNFVRNFLCF